jgi:hypothetical protein
MAGIDYRRCDVCGGKSFYDADLGYGSDQENLVIGTDYSLGFLGDWIVICRKCSGKYEARIIEKEQR